MINEIYWMNQNCTESVSDLKATRWIMLDGANENSGFLPIYVGRNKIQYKYWRIYSTVKSSNYGWPTLFFCCRCLLEKQSWLLAACCQPCETSSWTGRSWLLTRDMERPLLRLFVFLFIYLSFAPCIPPNLSITLSFCHFLSGSSIQKLQPLEQALQQLETQHGLI